MFGSHKSVPLTYECEVRFKDLLYAKHGIFYKDNCGHIKEVLVAVLHILVHIRVYNKKYQTHECVSVRSDLKMCTTQFYKVFT